MVYHKGNGSMFFLKATSCETLCAGSYNLQVSISDMLAFIVQSECNGVGLKHLELTGCLHGSIHHLRQLRQLHSLILHFYCHQESTTTTPPSLQAISFLVNLKTLILQQEFCFEEQSVIEPRLFETIVTNCGQQLEVLEILGDFGWRLQLDDGSLNTLATSAPRLRHLALAGSPPLSHTHL